MVRVFHSHFFDESYMERVAVIISTYEADSIENLRLSLTSLLRQTHRAFDIFLYCDGQLNPEMDSFVTNLSELQFNLVLIKGDSNKGLANALNCLIDAVLTDKKYEFIARMDSDDIAYASRLQAQVDFLNNNRDVDVCGTSCREFGASFAKEEKHLPVQHEKLLDFSIYRCPFIHPSVMFRRRVFEWGHRYPENTRLTEDMALWFELLESKCRFANLNEILLDYRVGDEMLKRRKGLGKALSEVRIRYNYMIRLRRVSAKNIIMITARLAFHLLPTSVIRILYHRGR